jgi:uncharacterized protein (TIGR00106 family)
MCLPSTAWRKQFTITSGRVSQVTAKHAIVPLLSPHAIMYGPRWSKPPVVLLEMSVTPLGKGESVSQYVAECVELVERSGLDYELHSMGTIVEGELDQVLDLMRRCIEQVATHSDRVTCAAKLDFRKGQSGRLKSKVASVEQKLGRDVRKSH